MWTEQLRALGMGETIQAEWPEDGALATPAFSEEGDPGGTERVKTETVVTQA